MPDLDLMPRLAAMQQSLAALRARGDQPSQTLLDQLSDDLHAVTTDVQTRLRTAQQAEDRYSALFNNHHSVMLIIEPDSGQIVDANPAACAYYGYPHALLISKNIADINTLPPHEVQAEMQRARQFKQNFFNFRHRLASGEIRDVEVRSGAITLAERPLLYSIIHDVTERRRTEDDLQRSEEKYRRLFNSAQVGIFRSSIAEGRILEANQKLAQMFGYDRTEDMRAIVLSAIHYVDPLDRARLLSALQDDGTFVTIEIPFKRQDGSRLWVIMEARKDVAAHCIEGVMIDITAHRLTADALLESEVRNRSIVEALSEGILLQQRAGDIVFANDSAARLLGVTREQLIGRGRLDPNGRITTLDGLPMPADAQPGMVALRTGQPVREVLAGVLKPDGSQVWLSANAEPMFRAGDPEPYAVVTSFADVSDRVQAEARQHQINEELEQRVAARTAELSESKERLQLTLEATRDGFWDLDLTTNTVIVSPSLIEMLGYTAAEFDANVNWFPQRVHPDDWASVQAANVEHLAGRSSMLDVEHRMHTAGGEWRWMRTRGKVVTRDAAGRPQRFVGTLTDITERKQTEVRLRALLDAIPDIMFVNRLDGRYVDYHATQRARLAMPPEQFLGKYPADVLPPELAVLAMKQIEHVVQTGESVTYSYPLTLHTRTRHFEARVVMCGPAEVLTIVRDITDQKQAADALRQSEEDYRSLFENASIGIFHSLPEGRFLRVNPMLANMLGYASPDELLSTITDIGAQLYLEPGKRINLLDATHQRPGWIYAENRYRCKDGSILIANLAVRQVLKPDGILAYLEGFVEDITERRRAEDALRESEALYHALVETLPMNIFRKDLAGRFTFVNRLYSQTQGRPPAELLGKTDFELHPVELAQKYRADDEAIMASGQPIEVIEAHQPLGGQPIYVQAIKTPLYDAAGHPIGIQGVFWDITQQRQAEAALLESETRYRTLFEAANDAIFIHQVRPDGFPGDILAVNNVACEWLGYTREELLHTPVEMYDAMAYQDEAARAIDQLRTVGDATFERLCVARDSRRFPVEINARQVELNGAQVYMSIMRDITQRKQAETVLKQALQRERELNQLKTQFVSMVSHEFRTPLTAIQSTSDLLQHYGHRFSEEKKQGYLDRIQAAIKRMTTMLDEVLILGRAESGKLEFAPSPIDLEWFCGALIDEFQLTAGEAYTLNLTFDGDCRTAYLDENLLRHILTNLISNAIKYSPNGGSIEFTVTCQAPHVIFRVTDHGIGIPPEGQARLFETFYRANNVGNIQGTGLGLAIVKHAVDLHRGTIMFDSVPDRGTTFVVTLPVDAV